MVLSISEILNGVDEYQEVTIEALNDTVCLRPLSKAEWAKVDSIRQEALGDYVTNEKAKAKNKRQRVSEIESQLKFNIKENGDAEIKAQIEAIHISYDNPGNKDKVSKAEIEQLPSNIFDEIYEKVCEISGINLDLEEEVKEFPEDE